MIADCCPGALCARASIFERYLSTAAGRAAQLVQLGDTLASWSEEIARMWRFTRSNGITEGFHNKMELITRRAYGLRSFESYILRVKVLCG